MNDVILLQHEGFDGLVRVERPMPQPGKGQVLVRMHAASLNNRDLQIATGTYFGSPASAFVPLSDGAGEVVETGECVTRVKPGDRVAATFWQRWSGGGVEALDSHSSLGYPIDGMLQRYALFDEGGLVKVPAHLSYEEAATLPCAALTAWYSLVTMGHVKAGDTVLVQGTGGVSIFALQFARLNGARVILLSSSDAKLERAREFGVFAAINYSRTPEWHEAVREATGGRGVDHVIEVGGPDTMSKSLKSLAQGGQLNVIGYLAGKTGALDPIAILTKRVTLRGIPVGSREAFEAMNRAIAASGMRPVIDRVFPWSEIRGAFEYFATAAHLGKVVVTL